MSLFFVRGKKIGTMKNGSIKLKGFRRFSVFPKKNRHVIYQNVYSTYFLTWFKFFKVKSKTMYIYFLKL